MAATFINLDLFDEYRLLLHPIELGQGLDLFASIQAERPLTLIEAKPFPSGVVLVRYARQPAH